MNNVYCVQIRFSSNTTYDNVIYCIVVQRSPTTVAWKDFIIYFLCRNGGIPRSRRAERNLLIKTIAGTCYDVPAHVPTDLQKTIIQ